MMPYQKGTGLAHCIGRGWGSIIVFYYNNIIEKARLTMVNVETVAIRQNLDLIYQKIIIICRNTLETSVNWRIPRYAIGL